MPMKLVACVAALLTLTFCPLAFAEEHDPAAAEALFRQGKDASKRGDWSTACKDFAASQKLDPAPGTLLNLADCEERQRQLASAWEHFVQAGDQLKRGDDRVQYARGRAQALEKRVPRLLIRLAPGTPEGTKVTRSDVLLDAAALGTPLPIDPGEYLINVSAPNHRDQRFTVTMAEGEAEELVVEPGEALPKTEPHGASENRSTAPTPSGNGGGRRTVGWVLGGIGVAGIGAGAVTGLMAMSRATTYKSNCDTGSGGCNAAGLDAAQSGKTLATISTVAFAGGAAVLALGTVLIVTGGSSSAQTTGNPRKPASTVGFFPLPGGAALSWERGF